MRRGPAGTSAGVVVVAGVVAFTVGVYLILDGAILLGVALVLAGLGLFGVGERRLMRVRMAAGRARRAKRRQAAQGRRARRRRG